MIKNTKICNSKKVITDCNSSYESMAKESNWILKQIKSVTYADEKNNNLANIISLYQQIALFYQILVEYENIYIYFVSKINLIGLLNMIIIKRV